MRAFIFFITFIIICPSKLLYSNVVVNSFVDKKSIFYFQDIIYTIEIKGEYQTFSFDGIRENDINDFDIINKNVESTITHSDEYKTPLLNKKIIYTMKPISKGAQRIPALDVKYFTVDENKVLSESSIKLDSILIHVYGNGFLIFSIVSSVLILIIAIVVIITLLQRYKKNKL